MRTSSALCYLLAGGAGVKMEHFQAALDPRKQELLEARFLGARVSLNKILIIFALLVNTSFSHHQSLYSFITNVILKIIYLFYEHSMESVETHRTWGCKLSKVGTHIIHKWSKLILGEWFELSSTANKTYQVCCPLQIFIYKYQAWSRPPFVDICSQLTWLNKAGTTDMLSNEAYLMSEILFL